jgi:hypothetical protein
MLKAEIQMAEEIKGRKNWPNDQLAESLKWPKTANSTKIW